MLKKSLALMSVLFFIVSPSFAVAQDVNVEARRALSAQLHEVWGVRDDVKRLVETISSRIPEEQRAPFREYMSKVLDLEKIKAISVQSAVDVFTEDELRAMVAYYTSDAGQSAEKKRERYNEKITPLIQQMMQEGMAEAMQGVNGGAVAP